MKPLYDKIGIGYAIHRQPDPRIAQSIHRALGDAQTILNVGAGSGSYEPRDRYVTALEPSSEMIRQRPLGAADACQGVAENIPFHDGAFDAAMAVLTVHHWSDVEIGLRELRRVATRRVVILTFDPAGPYFWLADYLPEIIEVDQPKMPKIDTFRQILGNVDVLTVPVPHDCTDGFLGAYWRRPTAYLEPQVRSAISTFSLIKDPSPGLKRLETDVSTGAWAARYGDLLDLTELDIGYRLIVAECS